MSVTLSHTRGSRLELTHRYTLALVPCIVCGEQFLWWELTSNDVCILCHLALLDEDKNVICAGPFWGGVSDNDTV